MKFGNLKNILFSIFAIFIFFVLVEGMLLIYSRCKYGKDIYAPTKVLPISNESKLMYFKDYWKFIPGKHQISSHQDFYFGVKSEDNTEAEGIPFTINSYGFRGEEILEKKGYRICALGGSTTFGDKVKDNETYPYQLGEISRYEVINCGFPAYKMNHTYHLFKKELLLYEPDMTIIYSAWNDAFLPVLVERNILSIIHRHLYYKCRLYTLLIEKYSLWKYNTAIPFFLKAKELPQSYVKYLNLLINLAQENEIKVVLVVQAYDGEKTDKSLEQLEEIYKTSYDTKERNWAAFYYNLKQIEKIGKERNIKVINPVIKNEFIDGLHLTPKGYKLLAETIAKEITLE